MIAKQMSLMCIQKTTIKLHKLYLNLQIWDSVFAFLIFKICLIMRFMIIQIAKETIKIDS